LKTERLSEAILSSWEDIAEEDSEAGTGEVPSQESTLKWAEDWLYQKLTGLKVTLFGGLASAEFSSVVLTGDLSIAVDKSPPSAHFNFKMEIKWLVKSSTGISEGILVVDNFTPEKGADGAIMDVQTVGKKVSGQLLAAFRQNGLSAVRSTLAQFVDELQQRVESPRSA